MNSNETFPSNLSILVNTSVCAYKTSNCLYYNSYGLCEICRNGYIQRSRKCVIQALNCIIPVENDTTKCLTCMKGYQLEVNSLICIPRL